jgi:DNA-binding NtrC family response regulator
VSRVAATDASVLITGESGTGKELVAEALHRNSRRRDKAFVKVNLGGISSTLFESEMFGHVRGAFTDARSDREGRFALADGGTIFLDEIGELEPDAQVKLLRVLQDRTFEPLGSSRTRVVDVRVISATNRPLPGRVAEGRFREDLYYRLNLISIHLPPLRERVDDIALLARRFALEAGERYRGSEVELDDEAVAWLRARPWPGNVRELRQTIERVVLVSDSGCIGRDVLRAVVASAEPGGRGEGEADLARAGVMTLESVEREMIRKCLRAYDGNLTRVAEALGLSRGTLYRRLEKHGLK